MTDRQTITRNVASLGSNGAVLRSVNIPLAPFPLEIDPRHDTAPRGRIVMPPRKAGPAEWFIAELRKQTGRA